MPSYQRETSPNVCCYSSKNLLTTKLAQTSTSVSNCCKGQRIHHTPTSTSSPFDLQKVKNNNKICDTNKLKNNFYSNNRVISRSNNNNNNEEKFNNNTKKNDQEVKSELLSITSTEKSKKCVGEIHDDHQLSQIIDGDDWEKRKKPHTDNNNKKLLISKNGRCHSLSSSNSNNSSSPSPSSSFSTADNRCVSVKNRTIHQTLNESLVSGNRNNHNNNNNKVNQNLILQNNNTKNQESTFGRFNCFAASKRESLLEEEDEESSDILLNPLPSPPTPPPKQPSTYKQHLRLLGAYSNNNNKENTNTLPPGSPLNPTKFQSTPDTDFTYIDSSSCDTSTISSDDVQGENNNIKKSFLHTVPTVYSPFLTQEKHEEENLIEFYEQKTKKSKFNNIKKINYNILPTTIKRSDEVYPCENDNNTSSSASSLLPKGKYLRYHSLLESTISTKDYFGSRNYPEISSRISKVNFI